MKTEIIKYLVLGKSEKEILQALTDAGYNEAESKELLKASKEALKKARIPSRKELSLLTSAMLCDAMEAQQFAIAQKLLGDLTKIARIDNAIDFKLPKFENSEQFLMEVLKNLDDISPAMLGNLARFVSVLNLSKQEKDNKDAESEKEPETTEEWAKTILKLVK